MRELAVQFLALADKQSATAPLMVGRRLMGVSVMFTGDIAEARAQLDRAVALYDPAEHRPLATRFGADVRVSTLTIRALALWQLGYPAPALADTDHALRDAREIGQAATLMHALGFVLLTLTLCGNYATANSLVDELAASADEKGSLFWKAQAMLVRGWLFAQTDKASDALQIYTAGITSYRSTGSSVWVPIHLSMLARAYGKLGQINNAWRCIGEAHTMWKQHRKRGTRLISIASPAKSH
jgi:predicted ATPase